MPNRNGFLVSSRFLCTFLTALHQVALACQGTIPIKHPTYYLIVLFLKGSCPTKDTKYLNYGMTMDTKVFVAFDLDLLQKLPVRSGYYLISKFAADLILSVSKSIDTTPRHYGTAGDA
jgi:hypothetical protein